MLNRVKSLALSGNCKSVIVEFIYEASYSCSTLNDSTTPDSVFFVSSLDFRHGFSLYEDTFSRKSLLIGNSASLFKNFNLSDLGL